ncbi:MAG: hypothetical protein L3K18_07100 [Thermoplasmata archaeon]|nr:hypothetical protein [Thermoplasmata archaeon]
MGTPADDSAATERRRVSRQRKVVGGVALTLVGIVALLAAPDLTGPLVHDLPFLAVGLLALYAGGILMGVGFGQRSVQR